MISSVTAIAKTPSLKASSRAVSLLTPEILASATDGPAVRFATRRAGGRQQEHGLRPRRVRVPGDDDRHDAADAALPALRAALLVRRADGDGDLRRLRLRRDRGPARVREPVRRDRAEAGAADRARVLGDQRVPVRLRGVAGADLRRAYRLRVLGRPVHR